MKYSVWISQKEAQTVETSQFLLAGNLSKEQAESAAKGGHDIRPDLPRNPRIK